MISNKIGAIKEMIINNKKVIENYFFMTVLSVLNSFFGLFIYPYLIKTLGTEQYGEYVFILSIVTYFVNFISFGFDLIAIKKVVEYGGDIRKKSEIVSIVFTSRLYLQLLSTLLYGLIVLLIPSFRENYILHISIFSITFANVLFFSWYFQAIQKMKLITLIQLLCKLVSLPFIFLFVNDRDDLVLFAIISTSTNILGGILSMIILIIHERISIKIILFSILKKWYKEAFPLFLTNSISVLKEQGAVIIIGSFFGMREVAIYDLAMKVISIPRFLIANVNAAIFPKLLENITMNKVKNIIKYEYIVGIVMMFIVIFLGYWAILFLGGTEMIESYSLLLVTGPTIVAWLVVGAYIYFVFLPNRMNYLITINQLVAMLSFFILSFIGIMISDKIIILCIAMTLSGFIEIFYCRYLIRKHRLLV